jgi:DNA-binding CsgD family transcriptional regulator
MLTARTGHRYPGIPRQRARVNPEAALGCHVRSEPGHDRCSAARAAFLLVRGERRIEAVRLALDALGDPCCRENLRCVWHAVLTLIDADEVAMADCQTGRLHGLPCWQGDPAAAAVFDLLMGRIAFLVGDVAAARDAFERLLAANAYPAIRITAVAWLVELHFYVGDLDSAMRVLAGLGYATTPPDQLPLTGRAQLLLVRGVVAVASGRSADGFQDLLACGKIAARTGLANPAALPWRGHAACAAANLSQSECAQDLAYRELAGARAWGAPRGIGCALVVTALSETGQQCAELAWEAVDLLELAHARSSLPVALTVLGMHLARACDDRLGSQRMLVRACELAGECGISYWAERAAVELRGFEQASELTSQEQRVAKLAIAGFKNRQIADRLSLTRRTVEFHLSSVYRKLGISSRRDLSQCL